MSSIFRTSIFHFYPCVISAREINLIISVDNSPLSLIQEMMHCGNDKGATLMHCGKEKGKTYTRALPSHNASF